MGITAHRVQGEFNVREKSDQPVNSWVSLSDHTEPAARTVHSSVSPGRLETPRVPSVFVLLASASRAWHIIATQIYGARKFLWAGGSFHSVN